MADEGTQRAQTVGMHDADAIEAINSEQLATATDRLLLRGGQLSRYSVARGAHGRIAVRAERSQVATAARLARARAPDMARPAHVRSARPQPFAAMRDLRPHPRYQRRSEETTISVRTPMNRPLFAIGVAIPMLVGLGLVVAALR